MKKLKYFYIPPFPVGCQCIAGQDKGINHIWRSWIRAS